MTVTADDLEAAVATMVTTLRPATRRDWSVPAGAVEWDCWHTAEHIGDVLLSYAGQLVAQPTTRYVRFMANADKDAAAAEVLEFAEAGGRILAATVRTSPPQVRAYHPTGMADPEGFAGMGCVEALVHGHDIGQGLGLALDPPREGSPACSPGCSRTPWLTWPAWTRGADCCGPPAGSRCPGARGLSNGAGAALRRTGTAETPPRRTRVMEVPQTPARPSRRKRPTREDHDLRLEY
jgi:hypothetical protein